MEWIFWGVETSERIRGQKKNSGKRNSGVSLNAVVWVSIGQYNGAASAKSGDEV